MPRAIAPLQRCPHCRAPFTPFLRRIVRRPPRVLWVLWKRPSCAVICRACKAVVGYEWPSP